MRKSVTMSHQTLRLLLYTHVKYIYEYNIVLVLDKLHYGTEEIFVDIFCFLGGGVFVLGLITYLFCLESLFLFLNNFSQGFVFSDDTSQHFTMAAKTAFLLILINSGLHPLSF